MISERQKEIKEDWEMIRIWIGPLFSFHGLPTTKKNTDKFKYMLETGVERSYFSLRKDEERELTLLFKYGEIKIFFEQKTLSLFIDDQTKARVYDLKEKALAKREPETYQQHDKVFQEIAEFIEAPIV
ncbi:hypothetical protein IMZ31_22965 (plasmid) [Pontibacillus sp. ALD_SL1]|uniref:hypothetical protein n=1 Tax=Pontibacillus sp. ALD_SL1 TaxID=2777185 RepID=UPI001A9706A8|nr:hypothetical protein [Pontibacillus sp. ALD_SL1]QST02315.1 hypothetical protein IMZ31_22965 [Pontibacillus sp. ALD_SL1]